MLPTSNIETHVLLMEVLRLLHQSSQYCFLIDRVSKIYHKGVLLSNIIVDRAQKTNIILFSNMISIPSPTLVSSAKQLQAMLRVLLVQPAVAVDTESNSMHAYRERVCLIQFSIPGCDYIVDPLAIQDLTVLQPLFADDGIEKVFHAAEYDMICLWRDFGCKVRGLFDTMMAARALGWERVGLAAILRETFSVSVSKKFQRADWGKRPLSADQLTYAQLDTRYLLRLREHQYQELHKRGQWPEVREEFERISRVSSRNRAGITMNERNTEGFWRINGVRKLSKRECAVLRELYIYRELVAERIDQPISRVIGDGVLLRIAQRSPRVVGTLRGVHGLSGGQIKKYGSGILQAVQRGLRARPPVPPQVIRGGRSVSARYQALREWRKLRAQRRGITSDVILAREVMWALAQAAPTSMAELDSIPDLGPWRRTEYGEEILNLFAETDSK